MNKLYLIKVTYMKEDQSTMDLYSYGLTTNEEEESNLEKGIYAKLHETCDCLKIELREVKKPPKYIIEMIATQFLFYFNKIEHRWKMKTFSEPNLHIFNYVTNLNMRVVFSTSENNCIDVYNDKIEDILCTNHIDMIPFTLKDENNNLDIDSFISIIDTGSEVNYIFIFTNEYDVEFINQSTHKLNDNNVDVYYIGVSNEIYKVEVHDKNTNFKKVDIDDK